MTSPAPGSGALRAVTRKAVISSKPAPLYTAEAHEHGVAGTVRLTMLLDASGEVREIRPVMTLPDGLTEAAVEAAQRIEFVPAELDGRPVSQYVTVDYRFDVR
jgi:TonB family protein